MESRGISKRERPGADSHGARAAISVLFKQIKGTTRQGGGGDREAKKAGRIRATIGGERAGGVKNTKKREVKEQPL